MLPRRPEKLKARCEEAAQMKEQWILEHLEVKDLYNPRHKDPAGYYKWPLTLLANKGWEILAECFEPNETGIRRSIIDKHWPRSGADAAEAEGQADREASKVSAGS